MNHLKPFHERKSNFKNELARKLIDIMQQKQSNFSVAVDVTDALEVLILSDAVGPFICCLKTHIDIVTGFESDTVAEWIRTHLQIESSGVSAIERFTLALERLALKHNFIIFEDRKFADIGRTVQLQYAAGAFKIVNWADLTNAHIVPGDGIITGLKAIGLAHQKPRALLLLAEMSSKGTLAKGQYSEQAYNWAKEHSEFVIGFIGQHRLDPADDMDFLYMTPGVKLSTEANNDKHGQQYRTPETVILEDNCDIIIVGRGIYENLDCGKLADQIKIKERCEIYRAEAWNAYLKRIS